ncbi:hypothetical protein FQN52_008576 [Onygenales sp. PD_12]|nr:hypothetical protein FQN52_008576 [Onygenales sp. PD_12]
MQTTMSIHRLPSELLTHIIESDFKPNSSITDMKMFFRLRLVCKTFDAVVMDTLLNNLKGARAIERLPDGILQHILFQWVGQSRLTDDLFAGLVDSATNIILSVLARKEDDNNDKRPFGEEQVIREKYRRILCDAHIAHLKRETREPTRRVADICHRISPPLVINNWRITDERANNTAMAAAVHAGDAELLRLLLEADTAGIRWKNTHFGDLAIAAVRRQDETLMNLLVDNGVDVFMIEKNELTPLQYMARFGLERTIQRAVANRASDFNHLSDHIALAISEAIGSQHPDIATFLLRVTKGTIGEYDIEPLRSHIARAGYLDVLKVLMEYDPAVSPPDGAQYSEALVEACEGGHEDVVRHLVNTFNDPDFINRCDSSGTRGIEIAVKKGHEAIIRLLLDQQGILPDIADREGRTPFHLAAIHYRENIFKMLPNRVDVDINHEDSYGLSVLDFAVLNGRENLVKLLIHRDDLDINRTVDRRITLAHAVIYGHNNTVKLLLTDPRVDAQMIDFGGK